MEKHIFERTDRSESALTMEDMEEAGSDPLLYIAKGDWLERSCGRGHAGVSEDMTTTAQTTTQPVDSMPVTTEATTEENRRRGGIWSIEGNQTAAPSGRRHSAGSHRSAGDDDRGDDGSVGAGL